MILVIDNYDSFTWNLVQYLGELGAEMEVRRNDELSVNEIAAMAPERIVISHGLCAAATSTNPHACHRFPGLGWIIRSSNDTKYATGSHATGFDVAEASQLLN